MPQHVRQQRFAGLQRWCHQQRHQCSLPPQGPRARLGPPERQLVTSLLLSCLVQAQLSPGWLARPHLPGTLQRKQRPLRPQPLAELFQGAARHGGAAGTQGNDIKTETSSFFSLSPPIFDCVLHYQPFKLFLNAVPDSLSESNAAHIVQLIGTEARH